MTNYRCTNCKVDKPLNSDNFHKKKSNKTGYQTQCKECLNKKRKQRYQEEKEEVAEYNTQYYIKNKKAIQEQQFGYRERNREALRQYSKQYYQDNREYYREMNAEYYKNNREKHAEYMAQYYQDNKERISEYNRKHFQENKDAYRVQWQRRKARMAQLPHTLTAEEWKEALEYFDYSCAYCGNSECNLEQEHIVPVVKGGGYTADNIVPACRKCNSSKRTRDLDEWFPAQEFYSEERMEVLTVHKGYTERYTE